MESFKMPDIWRAFNLRTMETLTSSFVEMIDSNQLQQAVPQYLWFTIALLGLSAILYVLHRLVNFLIENISELKEGNIENSKAIAVMSEMLSGIKTMLHDHEQDIRSLQSTKRNRGQ